MSKKSLEQVWAEKLKDSGFVDQEDKHGNLKNPDIRTIAWENRGLILEFYLKLDQFMNFYNDMPKIERRVMELYMQNKQIKEIQKKTFLGEATIYRIIKRYKSLIRAIQKMEQEGC